MVGLGAKGAISPGKDADFVVWDPEREVTVGAPGADGWSVEHKHKVSPYVGMKLRGKVVATYLRGERIFEVEDDADARHKNRFAPIPYGRPLLRK